MSAPVVVLPLVASVPLQPPEAVHEVALVLLHERVEVPPDATLVASAVRITAGSDVVDSGVTGASCPQPASERAARSSVPAFE